MSWHCLSLPRALRPTAVVAALPEPRDGTGLRVGKDARPVDDAGVLGRIERHLNDVDAEERGVGIGSALGVIFRSVGSASEIAAGAASQAHRLTGSRPCPTRTRTRCRCRQGSTTSVWVCDPRQVCTAAT